MMNNYKGIKYLIKQNLRMYFWLAYVKLPKGSELEKKYFKKGHDGIDLNCHGGLTFGAIVTKENVKDYWQEFDEGVWVGWDYGHAGDFVDYGLSFENIDSLSDKRWEYKEIEAGVKDVIKQINILTHASQGFEKIK